MKCKQTTLVTLSGLVWLAVGGWLLTLGLTLLMRGVEPSNSLAVYPWLEGLAPILGSLEYAAILLIAVGLFIGYFKGRYVLAKSAHRGLAHIRALPPEAPFYQMYATRNYILIGLMMGLGMSIKAFGVPSDIRGFIDVAVGSALIQGSMTYFRGLWSSEPALL